MISGYHGDVVSRSDKTQTGVFWLSKLPTFFMFFTFISFYGETKNALLIFDNLKYLTSNIYCDSSLGKPIPSIFLAIFEQVQTKLRFKCYHFLK